MLEREFQQTIVAESRAVRAVVLNKAGSLREGKGWPDLFIWHPIWQGALELKVVERKTPVTQDQWDRIEMLRAASCDARVWYVSEAKGVEFDDSQRIFEPKNKNYSKLDPVRAVLRFKFLADGVR